MLCQHCNHNEADYHFVVSYGGQSGDVHLCAGCAHKLAHQYQNFFASQMPYLGWAMQSGQAWDTPARFAYPDREPEVAERFPKEADSVLQRRRWLGELRYKLSQAVKAEDYEAAAKLRDEIASAERAPVGGENQISS